MQDDKLESHTTEERCDCGGRPIFDDDAGTAYCPSCKSIEKYIPPRNKTTHADNQTTEEWTMPLGDKEPGTITVTYPDRDVTVQVPAQATCLSPSQRRWLRHYQEVDECWPHDRPCTDDPAACGCWEAMRKKTEQ